MRTELKKQESGEYQIYIQRSRIIAGGGLLVCSWIFIVYKIWKDEIITNAKDFCIIFTLTIAYAWFIIIALRNYFEKFVVTDRTITQYIFFVSPRVYSIDEITKVVVSHGRGGLSYRICIGEKKIFALGGSMVNLPRFIGTLQERRVPFESSVL